MTQGTAAARYVAGLPKAELHMHIEGSIEPGLMFELAARNGVELRWNTVEEVRAAYDFRDLQSFLDLYYDGCRVLLAERDFFDVTRAYLRRAHADNVRHAEMFLGPQGHTRRGVPLAAALEGTLAAMAQAEREDGITSGLILGAQRHLPEEDALAMMAEAAPWHDRILGYGLGGAEVGNPPAKFARFFAAARERGLRVTAHAGEEGPAEYVRESLELLQVDRIDHGNSCMDDPALVAELALRGTPLTVCPLSNLRLRVVEAMERHPLADMLAAGLRATVNSDDPSYFGGYVNDNYLACHRALGLGIDELTQLARNSVRAAFIGAERRVALLDEIDAWRAGFAA